MSLDVPGGPRQQRPLEAWKRQRNVGRHPRTSERGRRRRSGHPRTSERASSDDGEEKAEEAQTEVAEARMPMNGIRTMAEGGRRHHGEVVREGDSEDLSLIHISEPTRPEPI
eukprot:8007480-Pyramimonas_sp.AAC.1